MAIFYFQREKYAKTKIFDDVRHCCKWHAIFYFTFTAKTTSVLERFSTESVYIGYMYLA